MFPKKQVFFVLGLSKSGKAAAEFLLSRGASVYVYDDNVSERIEQISLGLVEKGAKRLKAEELPRMPDLCDALVLSPGVPIDHPTSVAFKRNGRAVIGETELAARYMRTPVFAVTGTNGKTTTVSMLTEVLKRGGYNAESCGNIGTPMIEFCGMKEDGIAVAEISSFQLETLQSLCPHIAIVLNVTEDHLNRHYNMENYVFLKAKLLKNMSESEFAILNYDDPIVRGFAEKTRAKVLYFSVKDRVRGAYYEAGNLYCGKEKIMSADQLSMGGLHNIQNALAVIIAAKLAGIKTETICAALSEMKGIRHRIESIAEIDGVRYVDDSKGTNVDATLKAVEAMKEDIVLLLGGKNKGYDYSKLFAQLKGTKVVHTILYGENRFALLKAAREQEFDAFTLCGGGFSFAVRVAAIKAERGQTVLLSPASASFDEFGSYEERGEKFAEIVEKLVAEKREQTLAVADGNQDGNGAVEYENT